MAVILDMSTVNKTLLSEHYTFPRNIWEENQETKQYCSVKVCIFYSLLFLFYFLFFKFFFNLEKQKALYIQINSSISETPS